jgi:hypothetical protein
MKSFLLPERWKREAFFIYATTDQSPLLRKILLPIVPLLLGVPTTQQHPANQLKLHENSYFSRKCLTRRNSYVTIFGRMEDIGLFFMLKKR